MKNLSYTQEYYLCAVNEKGDVPMMRSVEIHSSLFAGGILELLEHGFIRYEDNDEDVAVKNEFVAVAKPLDDEYSYLKPLYDVIASQKKVQKLKNLVLWEFKPKLYNEIQSAIGASLAHLNVADEMDSKGLFKNKTKFVPKPEVVASIIEKIRAEFLESGVITDETLCLTALLDRSKILGNYFSKVESENLKKRLGEVRGSEAYATVKAVMDVVSAGIAVS